MTKEQLSTYREGGKPIREFLKDHPHASLKDLADLVNYLDTGLIVDQEQGNSFVIRHYDPRGLKGKHNCVDRESDLTRTFCQCIGHLEKNGLGHDPDHCFHFHPFEKKDFLEIVPILQTKVDFETLYREDKYPNLHWDDHTKLFVHCNGESPQGKRTDDGYKMFHAYRNGKPVTVQYDNDKVVYVSWNKEKWTKNSHCPVYGNTERKRFAPVYRFSFESMKNCTGVPPVAEEAPPVAEEAPPVAEEAPKKKFSWSDLAEEAPPVVEEAPPVVEEAPPVVEEAPPVVEINANLVTTYAMFQTAFMCYSDPKTKGTMSVSQVKLWAEHMKEVASKLVLALEAESS